VTRALQGSERLSASFLILILIMALAVYLRLYNLLPVERGLQFLQDYDEAVWDSTAQLMLQGYLPYRDFFATLPPVGIYLLAGVLRLVNVPWGNGVGFMATRYASVIYGSSGHVRAASQPVLRFGSADLLLRFRAGTR